MIRSVLLVDDDDDLRVIGEMALANVGGFEVRCASSGDEALTLLRDHTPDVILLDVMMPGLDGPALYARLREDTRTASIPVIFMTAKVRAHERQAFEDLGANGVIAKPFDPMTLADQVRALLA